MDNPVGIVEFYTTYKDAKGRIVKQMQARIKLTDTNDQFLFQIGKRLQSNPPKSNFVDEEPKYDILVKDHKIIKEEILDEHRSEKL